MRREKSFEFWICCRARNSNSDRWGATRGDPQIRVHRDDLEDFLTVSQSISSSCTFKTFPEPYAPSPKAPFFDMLFSVKF